MNKSKIRLSLIASIVIVIFVISGVFGHQIYKYISLFLITTLGGSIIPVGSPFIVLGGAVFGVERVPFIIIAATGYTTGFLINYYLAKFLGKSYVVERMSEERYESISRSWNRWGLLLLVAFVFIFILPAPILALFCGLFSVRLYYFIPITFAGNLFNSYIIVVLGESIGNLFYGL